MKKLSFSKKPVNKEKAVFTPVKDDLRSIEKVIDSKISEQPKVGKDFKKVEPPKDSIKVKLQKDTGWNWSRIILYLTALGIIGIIFFSQYTANTNPAFLILIWLFGMMCFMPLGIIFGWLFLDPYMRCKIWRRMRGKNYGIVNFFHKGSQRIVTRIKNLDDDVIIEGGRLWYLDELGISYLDKNLNKVLWETIKPEHIKTLPANIPVLFLDPETMKPLKFIKETTTTNPEQAGSVIQGFINTQIQKNIIFKQRGVMLFYIIVLAVTAITMAICFQMYQWLEEISVALPELQKQIGRLATVLSELQTPAELILGGLL